MNYSVFQAFISQKLSDLAVIFSKQFYLPLNILLVSFKTVNFKFLHECFVLCLVTWCQVFLLLDPRQVVIFVPANHEEQKTPGPILVSRWRHELANDKRILGQFVSIRVKYIEISVLTNYPALLY